MSTATILNQMRLILGDQGELFQARVVGDGLTSRYELPVSFIDVATFQAYKVDPVVVLAEGVDYTLDARAGDILLTVPLELNRALVTQGTHFQEFTTEDMMIFLNNGFLKHIADVDPPPVIDGGPGDNLLPPLEEQLVAIRGVIEALWALATDAAMDVDIITPDGISIPRAQRFAQLMQLIQYWEAEYLKIAQALNVGLFRIEMFNLRRVSRTTNRLVPLFRAREYDDRKPPQRIMLPIDTGGGSLITYRGLWSPTVDYKRNDIVDYLQQRYLAKQASGPATTVEDPSLDIDDSHWETTTINTGWWPH